MQLGCPSRASSIRGRLSTAACVLLASGAPAAAHADAGAVTQVDATMLLYGEESRANVAEPTVRVTRLYRSGRSLSAQLGLDVITGASPSGAMPSGVAASSGGDTPGDDARAVQTVTAASGGAGRRVLRATSRWPRSRTSGTRSTVNGTSRWAVSSVLRSGSTFPEKRTIGPSE